MTRQEAAEQFAAWLAATHPDLFLAAYNTAQHGTAPNTQGLAGLSDWFGGISDWLGSVGDTIKGAVSSVGTWLSNPDNTKSLAGLASTYLQTQAQKQVVNAQLSRVQASRPPLAISYTPDGQAVIPVTSAGTPVIAYTATPPQIAGYVPATPQLLSQFSAAGAGMNWSQYAPWILGIGGVVLLVSLIRRQ